MSTLGCLVADVAANGFGSPAVLVIGDVLREAEAGAAQTLDRPLTSRRALS